VENDGPVQGSLGSEQYQWMNCSIANLNLRLERGELKLLNTEVFARSRSGRRRTILRATCFLVLLVILAASVDADMPTLYAPAKRAHVIRLEERISDYASTDRLRRFCGLPQVMPKSLQVSLAALLSMVDRPYHH
jgi:hypothetical protein